MKTKILVVFYAILFYFVVLLFWSDNITTVRMAQSQSTITELKDKIESLKKSIDQSKSGIEDLNKKIDSYELENKELNDTLNNLDTTKKESKTYKESDLMLLARLINSEAGNQSFEGKLAVGTVVMNRIKSDEFPDTIRSVIFQKGQFSVVSNGDIHNNPSKESLSAAKKIMEGYRSLKSNVLYFYNPKFTDNNNWIVSRDVKKVIGDHAFAI